MPVQIKILFSWSRWGVVCLLCLTSLALPARAESDLADTERSERQLQYNRYFEEQLAKSRREVRQKFLTLSGSASMGYDDNVRLDSNRKGDQFHEEAARAVAAFDHSGIGFGPGTWGVEGNIQYRDYIDLDRFDYQITRAAPFVRVALPWNLRFSTAYTFDVVRYMKNKRLNTTSHGAEARLEQTLLSNLVHYADFDFEFKHYPHRGALTETGSSNEFDRHREDADYRVGYGARLALLPTLSVGAIWSWYFNDSNDKFLDYNDYKGNKIHAYALAKIHPRISWLVFGGYDRKDYDSRIFEDRSEITQEDEYGYGGTSAYLSLTNYLDIGFNYLYGQNTSNNAAQEYSFSMISGGVYLTL